MSDRADILPVHYPATLPAPVDGRPRLCVALSGGADSCALLHRLVCLREEGGDFALRAVHVHHGLQADADRFASHCRVLCEQLAVLLQVHHVDASAGSGQSPEAAARAARYRALAADLAADEVVLCAHHADDQAETLLLQLLRGAGVPGLAAMPGLCAFADGWLARPLLAVRRAQLRGYCVAHDLCWLEDGSNRDERHDRNYLRAELMPRLESRWPAAVSNLVRAATHQADAARLLEEVAEDDLGGAPGARRDTLPVTVLAALPERRRENALRSWLLQRGLRAPSTAQLARMLQDVLAARADAEPVQRWDSHELRRHAGHLYVRRLLPAPSPEPVPWPDPSQPLQLAHGRLEATPCTGAGVRAVMLDGGDLRVTLRRGGERLRPAGDTHTRELKKLLHASALPPWQRDGLPLLYAGERLLAVAGVCVVAEHAAATDEAGYVLRWKPVDCCGWPDGC